MSLELNGLNYRIEVDTSQAKPAVESLDQSVQKLDTTLQNVNKTEGTAKQQLSDLTERLAAMKQKATELTATLEQQEAQQRSTTNAASLLNSALGKYLTVGAVIGAIAKTGEYNDRLSDLAETTQLSIDMVTKLDRASAFYGRTIDTVSSTVLQLEQRIGGGQSSIVSALTKLGIAYDDIKDKSPDAQLREVVEAISQIANPAEKARAEMELLGRSGTKDFPALLQALHDTSASVEDVTSAAGNLDDAWVKLKAGGLDILTTVFAPLGPVLNGIASGFVYIADKARQGASQILSDWSAVFDYLRGKTITPPPVAGPDPTMPFVLPNDNAGFNAKTGVITDTLGNAIGTLDAVVSDMNGHLRDANRLSDQFAKNAERAEKAFEKAQEAALKAAIKTFTAQNFGADFWNTAVGRTFGTQDFKTFMSSGRLPFLLPNGNLPTTTHTDFYGPGSSLFDASTKGTNYPYNVTGRGPQNLTGRNPDGTYASSFSADDFFGMLGSSAHNLAQSFAQLQQASGNTVSGFAKAAGIFFNILSIADTSRSQIKLGLGQFNAKDADLNGKIQGLVNIASGLIGGIATLMQVTAPGSAHPVAGGALAGAQVGSAFGWGGALVGLGVGAIVGAARQPAHPDSPAIRDQEAQLEKQYGSLANIKRISDLIHVNLSDTWGNENLTDLKTFTAAVDVFNKKIAETNAQFANVTSNGGVAGNALMGTMLAQAQAGGQVGDTARQALGQFLTANVNTAAGGLQQVAGAGIQFTAGGASAVGAGTMALIAQMQSMGMSMKDILAALGPTIQSLQKQFSDLGVDGGAAFKDLNDQIAFLSDKTVGKTIDGIDGLTNLMVGLGNTGNLTEDTFKGLTGQIGDAYNKLIAQGKDGDRALRAMQPDLQKAWELEEKFGFKADDATQALIDMGLKNHSIGPDFKSDTDKMKDAIQKLIDKMQIFIDKILGVPDAVTTANQNMPVLTVPTAPGAPPPPNQRPPGSPGGPPLPGQPPGPGGGSPGPYNPQGPHQAALGGYVMPYGVVRYMSGGGFTGYWAPHGTDTVPAVLTPGEMVISRPDVIKAGGPGAVMGTIKTGPTIGGGGFTLPMPSPRSPISWAPPNTAPKGGSITLVIQTLDGADTLRVLSKPNVRAALAKSLTAGVLGNEAEHVKLTGAIRQSPNGVFRGRR